MTCSKCGIASDTDPCAECKRLLADLEDAVKLPAAIVWVAFIALCAYCLYIGTGGH